jgi:hypothetical protein
LSTFSHKPLFAKKKNRKKVPVKSRNKDQEGPRKKIEFIPPWQHCLKVDWGQDSANANIQT